MIVHIFCHFYVYRVVARGAWFRALQRERALGDERGESRSSADDDHLCLIAVIGGERPLKRRGRASQAERETETRVRDCRLGGKLENSESGKAVCLLNCAVVATFIFMFSL